MVDSSDAIITLVIERNAAQSPQQVCTVFDDGTSWTWLDSVGVAERSAAALASRGVRQSDLVLLFLPNGSSWMSGWLGVAALGATIVPVNTAYRGDGLRHLCSTSGARTMITSGDLAGRLVGLDLALDLIEPEELSRPGDQPAAIADPRRPLSVWDVHAINYTSGTTGPAKGVITAWLNTYFGGWDIFGGGAGLTSDDRWLVDLPLFHTAAQRICLAAFSVGASIAVRPVFAGRDYWRVARDAGVTRSLLAGSMSEFLWSRPCGPQDRDHSLRVVASAPLPPDVAGFTERFGLEEMLTAFGSTETGAPIVSRLGERPPPGACGRARPGIELRIVDGGGNPVPQGATGELVMRTVDRHELNLGYHRSPEATTAAWRDGWFYTGDAFRRDEHGRYYYVDRLRDSLRRRGENISSFEVERDVMAHPAIAEAACVGVPAEHGDVDVKVYVVLEPGAPFDPGELIGFLSTRMPNFMLPRYVETVPSLPKTETMRVRKHELRSAPPGAGCWDRERAGVRVTRDGVQRP